MEGSPQHLQTPLDVFHHNKKEKYTSTVATYRLLTACWGTVPKTAPSVRVWIYLDDTSRTASSPVLSFTRGCSTTRLSISTATCFRTSIMMRLPLYRWRKKDFVATARFLAQAGCAGRNQVWIIRDCGSIRRPSIQWLGIGALLRWIYHEFEIRAQTEGVKMPDGMRDTALCASNIHACAW